MRHRHRCRRVGPIVERMLKQDTKAKDSHGGIFF